jgi:DNA-nicking Smr family endonuclease
LRGVDSDTSDLLSQLAQAFPGANEDIMQLIIDFLPNFHDASEVLRRIYGQSTRKREKRPVKRASGKKEADISKGLQNCFYLTEVAKKAQAGTSSKEKKSSLDQVFKAANRKAASYAQELNEFKLLEFIDKFPGKNSIDFHGLFLHQALDLVDDLLQTVPELLAKHRHEIDSNHTRKDHFELIIITGRGSHSRGNRPVLQPEIFAYLSEKGYWCHKKEIGQVRVYFRLP